MWFAFWIFVLVVVIVGASVLIGRSISKRDAARGGGRLTRQEQVTAFKVAGGMQNRKENRR